MEYSNGTSLLMFQKLKNKQLRLIWFSCQHFVIWLCLILSVCISRILGPVCVPILVCSIHNDSYLRGDVLAFIYKISSS